MADILRIAEQLSQLSVMEAADLSRMLEEKWGVSAAAPAAQVASAETTAPIKAEEPSEFTIILAGVKPGEKLNVIKEVRAVTGLGLKEAKEFTEAAGPEKTLKESVGKLEAENLKRRLEEAGAIVTIH